MAPKDHPLAGRDSLDFVDTLGWEQVTLPAMSAVQQLLERSAAQSGLRLQSRAMVSNFEAALRMARAGLAICVMPQEIFSSAQLTENLRWVGLRDSWAKRCFLLCFRRRDELPISAKILLEYLRNRKPHLPHF